MTTAAVGADPSMATAVATLGTDDEEWLVVPRPVRPRPSAA